MLSYGACQVIGKMVASPNMDTSLSAKLQKGAKNQKIKKSNFSEKSFFDFPDARSMIGQNLKTKKVQEN